jgi:hypothetical protein
LCYSQQSSNVVVVNLGDNIKGVIHGGIWTSEGSFVQSLLEVIELQVYFYGVLSAVYDNVKVIVTGDNHSRLSQNIAVDNKNVDYNRLINEMTKSLLKAKGIRNVTLVANDHGINMFEINGVNCVAFHGDENRSFNGSSDVQRAKIQDKCLAFYAKSYKHSFSGHTHTFNMNMNQYGGVHITNGSLPGNTVFGATSGFSSISSIQAMCFVDKQGNIENVRAVNFDHIVGDACLES